MAITRAANENKVAHAMATHSRLATHEWRHRVRIKDLFVDEASHAAVDALCERAVAQLKHAIESENIRRDQKDDNERQYFIQQLDNAKDGFDTLIGAGQDTIEEREEQFNYLLSELYDIGDTKIELRDGKLQKFLWVE